MRTQGSLCLEGGRVQGGLWCKDGHSEHKTECAGKYVLHLQSSVPQHFRTSRKRLTPVLATQGERKSDWSELHRAGADSRGCMRGAGAA